MIIIKKYRSEWKYLLSNQKLSEVKEKVSKVLELDKHTPVRGRNFTNKGYDYAIEFTSKDLEDIKKELVNNNNITKYSIIEYDADDIV